MADDATLRLGIQIDGVGNVQAGMQAAASSVQSAAGKMAASFIAQGLSAKEAQSALLNLVYTAKQVGAAMMELGVAEDVVVTRTAAATTSLSGFERAAAAAG